MINLLPKDQKSKITAEYKMRLVTVGAVLVLSVIIIATIIITPFYFSTKTMLSRTQIYFNNSKNSPDLEIDNTSKEIINETETELKLLASAPLEKLVSTDVIDMIVKNKGKTISINSMNYVNNIDVESKEESINKQITVTLGGIAQNREELKSFVYRLTQIKNFTNVSVPISNYLKGVDLEFIITFNIK